MWKHRQSDVEESQLPTLPGDVPALSPPPAPFFAGEPFPSVTSAWDDDDDVADEEDDEEEEDFLPDEEDEEEETDDFDDEEEDEDEEDEDEA